MIKVRWKGAALALAAAGALCVPAQASAGSWTRVASGTASSITGIEYQSAARFWFVTGSGEIFKRQPNGSFARTGNFPGVSLARIAFQPSGNIGIAVGDKGEIYRSTNAGASWAAVARPSGRNDACTGAEPLARAFSVRWAGNGAVYIAGGGNKLLRSTNGSTWSDVNSRTGGCKAKFNTSSGPGISDTFFVPASPNRGWMIGAYFGETYFAANVTAATAFARQGSSNVNGYDQPKRLVGDPGDPNRQWAVAIGEDGNGSYLGRTNDGWSSNGGWSFSGPRAPGGRKAQFDLAYAGGTVLSVGDGDQIETSTDGSTFFWTPSGTGANWRSVDLADGNNAAVGGLGGVLAFSGNAATLPDIAPPAGTLTPPKTVEAGWPTRFTVRATDVGAGLDPKGFAWTPSPSSGAKSRTGGGTIDLTFPKLGVFGLGVIFRDRAGNTGTAHATVRVVKPDVRFTKPGGKSPIGRPSRGRLTKLRVRGQLNLPAGVKRSRACRGNITITVNGKRRVRGKLRYRNVATRKARVSSKSCRYNKSLRFRRSRIRGRTIKVVLEFPGNTVVARSSYRKTLKLRK